MICEDFESRLYDEDCRAALLGKDPVPADVSAHTDLCPSCTASWAQATAEVRRFSEILTIPSPRSVHRILERSFRTPRVWIDVDMASWAIVGGALGAGFSASMMGLPQWSGFCEGACLGFIAAALKRSPINWYAPWIFARAALLQGIR